jgi:hypothetical protein
MLNCTVKKDFNDRNEPVAFKMNALPIVAVGLRLANKLSFTGTGKLKGVFEAANGSVIQNFTFHTNIENAAISVVVGNFISTKSFITSEDAVKLNWEIQKSENSWSSLESTNHKVIPLMIIYYSHLKIRFL